MSAALISTPSKSRRIDSLDDFKGLAVRMRVEIIKMIGAAGSGHPGGSLSEVELLAALYFRVLRHDPANPTWPDRDRFILSKGHGCPALYVAMIEAGYLDPAVLPKKLAAFGWNAVEIDGHDFAQVIPALEKARANKSDKPTAIIADTIKGKGVSFMENNPKWHGVAPKKEEVEAALKELMPAGSQPDGR